MAVRAETARIRAEQILRALVWVQDDPAGAPGLERVADFACMSPFHFHRIFREIVGETLDDHIRRLRMEFAAHHLRLSPTGIADLSARTGYANHAAFTRAFRTHFDSSPVAYRRAFRHGEWTIEEAFGGAMANERNFSLERRIWGGSAVERLPALRVAFVRQLGPYRGLHRPFARLARWASRRGLWDRTPVLIGAAHDDPAVTPAHQMRFDACLLVPDRVEGDGEVGVRHLRGGDYATASLVGGCAATWEGHGQWLACSYAKAIGRRVAKAPALEIYFRSPLDVAPNEVACDLMIPLE
ncbi:MAG: AraC family transcriptional regulator [Fimbriimonas sp.]